MKKFLIALMVVISFCIPFVSLKFANAEICRTVRVVYPYVYVYAQANAGETDAKIIKTCQYNDKLTTIGETTIFGAVDGLEYYQVVVIDVSEYESGYVLKSQVVADDIKSPQKKLVTNAIVSRECEVYSLEGTDYVKKEIILSNGTNIRILSGYDSTKEYTQIQFVAQDGEIITAYIKTNAIAVTGISRAAIGAIIIIATTVSLALIIFGISGKKKRKKLKLK